MGTDIRSIHPRSAHAATLRADYGTPVPVPLGFYGGELRRVSESTGQAQPQASGQQ